MFESLFDAELKVEPIDVRNGEFLYFDAEGQLLTASVIIDENGAERTTIHETVERIFDPATLRELLVDFLIAMGVSKFELEYLSFEELVGRSGKFASR